MQDSAMDLKLGYRKPAQSLWQNAGKAVGMAALSCVQCVTSEIGPAGSNPPQFALVGISPDRCQYFDFPGDINELAMAAE